MVKISRNLLFVLLLFFIMGSSFSIASNTPTLSVSSEIASRGSQVDIAIAIDNPINIAGVEFTVRYNKNVFEKVEDADVIVNSDFTQKIGLQAKNTNEYGSIIFVAGSGSKINTTEELGIINIRLIIKSNAPVGTYDITLEDVYISDGSGIPVEIVNGKVTVTSSGTGGSSSGGGGGSTVVRPVADSVEYIIAAMKDDIDDVIEEAKTKDTNYEIKDIIEKAIKESATLIVEESKINIEDNKASIYTDVEELNELIENAAKVADEAEKILTNLSIAPLDFKRILGIGINKNTNIEQCGVNISAEVIRIAKNNNISDIDIDMQLAGISITIESLYEVMEDNSESIRISVSKVSKELLSEDLLTKLGDSSIFDCNLLVDDNAVAMISDRYDVKISFGYQPKQGEEADKIITYSISNDEDIIPMKISIYDSDTEQIKFITNRLGLFTAGAANISFSDISHIDWAITPIEALAGRQILSGVGDGFFEPDRNVTREEFAKMLVEAFGFEDKEATTDLADVSEDAWYYMYVASAQKYGIVNGIGNNMFGVGTNITRQDMAVMAYRAAKAANTQIKMINDQESFADDEDIAEYARDSVTKMQQAGIINGIGENMFAPNDNATRAQAARIIYLAYKNIL